MLFSRCCKIYDQVSKFRNTNGNHDSHPVGFLVFWGFSSLDFQDLIIGIEGSSTVWIVEICASFAITKDMPYCHFSLCDCLT